MREVSPYYIILPVTSGYQDKQSIATIEAEYPWFIKEDSGVSYSSSGTYFKAQTEYESTDSLQASYAAAGSYNLVPTIIYIDNHSQYGDDAGTTPDPITEDIVNNSLGSVSIANVGSESSLVVYANDTGIDDRVDNTLGSISFGSVSSDLTLIQYSNRTDDDRVDNSLGSITITNVTSTL